MDRADASAAPLDLQPLMGERTYGEEDAMLESPVEMPSTMRYRLRRRLRRRWVISLAILVAGGVAVVLGATVGSESVKQRVSSIAWPKADTSESALHSPIPALVHGPPTRRYRDNLREDLNYITSFPYSGWTNQVIELSNLLYLAHLAGRTAILAHFTPSHIGVTGPLLAFGDVFNMSRLLREGTVPAVEWREVKAYNMTTNDVVADDWEDVGCWSLWMGARSVATTPHSYVSKQLGLDISFTAAPAWIKFDTHDPGNYFTTFGAVAALASPEFTHGPPPAPIVHSEVHDHSLPPDDKMLCFDDTYYVVSALPFDFERDYSPSWRFAGQHMRWVDALEDLAAREVKHALGVPLDQPVPPYIALHVRHGDFSEICAAEPLQKCFAPLSAFARHVRDVRQRVLERKGVEVEHVVVTSDESDGAWWDAVHALGWVGVGHVETEHGYGNWYPTVIDAVVQSNAIGFVGTSQSTMSIIALQRVETWHGGVGSYVRWGVDVDPEDA